MKLKHLSIRNFKGIRELDLDLTAPATGAPRRFTAILGDNGSGKTTVLQAIALVLSLATRKSKEMEMLNWQGFLPERISSLGETRVVLEVLLDDEEIGAAFELYETWYESRPPEFLQNHRVIRPERSPVVTLLLESGRLRCDEGPGAMVQLYGRHYIKYLTRTHPHLREKIALVGDVFWFDQYRNLGRVSLDDDESFGGGGANRKARSGEWERSREAGVEQLRNKLVKWWTYHLSSSRDPDRDYIAALEPLLGKVFPGTTIYGIEPRAGAAPGDDTDFYFLLERDGRLFDIAEMSSGEQGVFPMLYRFAHQVITRSVVLIDELELHLHPPQQQALLAALPRMGPDCQFIFTTHSPFLEGFIPDEEEVRLPGGGLCL